MALLTVSKLGGLVGASADTLRYYERIGLLPAPDRTPSGYRVYGQDSIERMAFIKGAQRLGLRLEEIKELLAIKDGGVCPCGHTRSLLERRATQLDDEMEAMSRMRGEIDRMLVDLGTDDTSRSQCNNLIQIETSRRDHYSKKRGEQ